MKDHDPSRLGVGTLPHRKNTRILIEIPLAVLFLIATSQPAREKKQSTPLPVVHMISNASESPSRDRLRFVLYESAKKNHSVWASFTYLQFLHGQSKGLKIWV